MQFREGTWAANRLGQSEVEMRVMEQKIVKGKWDEIKGEVRKAWGRLTEDELEKTKGDLKAVKGLIEQKYGQKKEDLETRLDDIFNRFSKNDAKTDSQRDQGRRQ